MSKKLLSLADLKKNGLLLTKTEANELLSAISQHAQHHPEDGIVYAGDSEDEEEEKPAKPETAAQKKAREKAESEVAKANAEAREKAVQEYTELFKEVPADNLSTDGIQELIDKKLSE